MVALLVGNVVDMTADLTAEWMVAKRVDKLDDP